MPTIDSLPITQRAAIIERAARICHEAVRIYNQSIGSDTPAWRVLKPHQRRISLLGVEWYLANPGATAEESHNAWLARAEAGGWSYGPVVDYALRQHPGLVPFVDLPEVEQRKEHLFRSVAIALIDDHLSKIQ